MRTFYVYILASPTRVLYVGVTNHLANRIAQHRRGHGGGSRFVHRYGVTRLVYAEEYPSVLQAIAREKQIKGWKRWKKVKLVSDANPEWKDLAGGRRED